MLHRAARNAARVAPRPTDAKQPTALMVRRTAATLRLRLSWSHRRCGHPHALEPVLIASHEMRSSGRHRSLDRMTLRASSVRWSGGSNDAACQPHGRLGQSTASILQQGRARLHGRRCLPEACIRLHGLPGHHGLRGSMLAQPADRCAGLQGLMVSDVWSSMRANRLQITARACKASWSLCLPQACRLPRGLPRLHSLNASQKPASTGQLDNNWSRGDRSVDWHRTLTDGGSTPPPLHHCRSLA